MTGQGRDDVHPPGRRRLRSAVRPDDAGDGVLLKTLIDVAEVELEGHEASPSGHFTNWVRFVKVDLECEGVIERCGRRSPQRVRLTTEPY